MENENVKLKQYFLGNLNLTEIEEIDLRVLSDETFEEKLYWAESELIEDFLDGALTPEETELFRNNFLVSPERKDHLKEIALLKKYVEKTRVPDENSVKSPDGFLQRLKFFFASNLRPAIAISALLIICLAFGITRKIFFDDSNTELTRLEREYAEANHKDLSNLTEFQSFSTLSLIPGTFRASDSPGKLKQEAITEKVFFRFALPFETGGETLFDVRMLRGENVVFRQDQIRAYKNQSGQEVRLIVPKSVLQKGQYQIRLEEAAAKNSPVTYSFAVE